MLRLTGVTALTAACVLAAAGPARADGPSAAPRAESLVQSALTRAWTAAEAGTTPAPAAMRSMVQRRAASSAGPNIEAVGLGAVAGLSDFEIGPSFRYWFTDRFGVQAHLGFSGQDWPGDDVEYIRFEPTFIVAIGDFGNAAVNVRPYAGGGLRLLRTDIGSYNDTDLRPAGVGGVEFGFRGVPRLKVSGELSLSAGDDFDDDFDLGNPPDLGGARFVALAHYFFD